MICRQRTDRDKIDRPRLPMGRRDSDRPLLAPRRSGVTMKNQNGVCVVIHATSQGVDLTIGPSGVDMKLKK
jgi:hypothetical protein